MWSTLGADLAWAVGALLVCGSAPGDEATTQAQAPWSLRVVALKAEYMVNEPVLLKGELTNTSERPLTLLWQPYGGGYEFAVGATKAALSSLDTRPAQGGLRTTRRVASGETIGETLVLNAWCRFSAPGDYVVQCRNWSYYYELAGAGQEHPEAEAPVCAAPYTSVAIRIIPEDSDKMGELAGSLLQAARDPRRDKRIEATRQLSWLTSEAALPQLVQGLDGKYEDTRSAAAEALGRIGSPAAIDVLLSNFGQMRGDAKVQAIRALGKLGVQEARVQIQACQGDERSLVREAALLALAQLGDPAAQQPLRERRDEQLRSAERLLEQLKLRGGD
jgi:hypothetical protein